MSDLDHMSADDLTPAQRAALDQNWAAANDDLTQLLGRLRGHRDAGCRNWFCMDEDTADILSSYDENEVHLLLRAAIERLMTEGRPVQ